MSIATAMADEKTSPVEEVKWWIDRGPAVKEREKETLLGRGIIEKWVYELLKDYSQDRAVQSVVDINPKILKALSVAPGEWGYLSLGVGSFPEAKLAKIKSALLLPARARGLVIDAGYSVRLLITGEPIGTSVMDVNFTESPSLDYWINGELVEETLFSSIDDALKRLRGRLAAALNPPSQD